MTLQAQHAINIGGMIFGSSMSANDKLAALDHTFGWSTAAMATVTPATAPRQRQQKQQSTETSGRNRGQRANSKKAAVASLPPLTVDRIVSMIPLVGASDAAIRETLTKEGYDLRKIGRMLTLTAKRGFVLNNGRWSRPQQELARTGTDC